jgi:acylphosphatase
LCLLQESDPMKATRLVLPLVLLAATLGGTARGDAKPDAKPVARMVYYTGKVQGVGFRASAVEISRDYTVTGWVKNLADGRVQLLAEGQKEAVEAFLKAIRTHWKDNIEKEDVQEQTASGKYKKFEIEP